MTMKTNDKVHITLVMGPHGVGKTEFCKKQQMAFSHVMVIPYDAMLHALRNDYDVSSELQEVVVDTVYDMVWGINNMSSNIHILIDGYAFDINSIERMLSVATRAQIVYLNTSVNQIVRNNYRKKKLGLPYVKHRLIKSIWEQTQFMNSNELAQLCKDYYVTFTRQDPFKDEKKLLYNLVG